MPGRTLLSLALIAWIAGCGRQETVTPPPAEPWKQDSLASTPSSQEDEPANEAHEPAQSGNDEDEPEESGDQREKTIDSSQAKSSGPAGDRTYNTGDCDDWPSYELPLVIEIEIPEFPEGVTRLAEPIPNEQE